MTGGVTHIPVLLDSVLAQAAPQDGAIIVDGTFGRGGYTRALLETADCRVIAIDRDPEAIAAGEAMMRRFPGRLTMVGGRFGDLDRILTDLSRDRVDAVVLDVGVSSPQLDRADRGFSYRQDGPLDMRMAAGREADSVTAADLVNRLDEAALTRILRDFGEERRARQIARAIIRARDAAPIDRTHRLAEVIRAVTPHDQELDTLQRSFQALRIEVNDELGELARALVAAEAVLRPGGRLIVVAFHSLEDRLVKRFMHSRAGRDGGTSRHLPEPMRRDPSFTLLTKRPVTASAQELAANPRAKSAKLRAAMRSEAPAWGEAA